MIFIPDDKLEKLTSQTASIGDVFLVNMNQADGVIPKGTDLSRDKFFVVLGFDDDGNVFGGVIVNSRINPRLPQRIADFHMPIKCKKYSFLKYDSFVDCLMLKTASLEKLAKSKLVGKIDEEDIDLIIGTVISSPQEKRIRLKRFGLI